MTHFQIHVFVFFCLLDPGKTPSKKRRDEDQVTRGKSKCKSTVTEKVCTAAKKIVKLLQPDRTRENTDKEVQKKAKRKQSRAERRWFTQKYHADKAHQHYEKEMTRKKTKLEEQTRGDFPRTVSSSGQKLPKGRGNKKGEKQLEQISKHLNHAASSPWERKEKAARRRGAGAGTGRSGWLHWQLDEGAKQQGKGRGIT